MNKFSSAARDKGTALASSESFTWLTEHFQASLAQVKSAADYLFLSGANTFVLSRHPLFAGRSALAGLAVLCRRQFRSRRRVCGTICRFQCLRHPLPVRPANRHARQ